MKKTVIAVGVAIVALWAIHIDPVSVPVPEREYFCGSVPRCIDLGDTAPVNILATVTDRDLLFFTGTLVLSSVADDGTVSGEVRIPEGVRLESDVVMGGRRRGPDHLGTDGASPVTSVRTAWGMYTVDKLLAVTDGMLHGKTVRDLVNTPDGPRG